MKPIQEDLASALSGTSPNNTAPWIAVSERLPKEGENVLVHFGGNHRPVREGYISRMTYNVTTDKDFDLPLWVDASEWFGEEGSPRERHGITHWMPLPPPPGTPQDNAVSK